MENIKKDQRFTFFSDGLCSSGDVLFSIIKSLDNVNSVMISTWQLGKSDAIRLVNFNRKTDIDLKILVDASYAVRCKGYYQYVKKNLGENIWMTRNHCKVMTISGDDKFISVLSSANFNKNFRLEFFDITESKQLFDMVNDAHKKFFLEKPIAENRNDYNKYVKKFKAMRKSG